MTGGRGTCTEYETFYNREIKKIIQCYLISNKNGIFVNTKQFVYKGNVFFSLMRKS